MELTNVKIKLSDKLYDVKCNISNSNGTRVVNIHATQASRIIRQYIKQTFGKSVKSSVRTEKYAGGSSVRVYLENVSDVIAKNIQEFSKQFQMGNFNGMDDSYNVKSPEYSDLGSELRMFTSYVFTYNNNFLV